MQSPIYTLPLTPFGFREALRKGHGRAFLHDRNALPAELLAEAQFDVDEETARRARAWATPS